MARAPDPTPVQDAVARRRRRIAGAVWRIAAGRGLDAASMREIAAEAGVSVRVVQYHFADKHDLMVAALRMLNEDSERHARARMARVDPADHRALLRALLEELLPADDQRRLALRVLAATTRAASPTRPSPRCSCTTRSRWRRSRPR